YEGQIVEVSPPKVEAVPLESDYLSEYDAATEHETRAERFEVNPEVLSREFSKEMQAEAAEVMDLNAEKESTGATVGNNRFDPDRNGSMSALPSPWKQTNQLGPQDPIPSSSRTASLSGAPQNDLLDEEIGKYVDLNTTRYPYAGYIQRIRRQVNYWWQQNLDNLGSSVRLSKSRYQTVVSVVLNADGALEHIEVIGESGSPELDDCLVRAFRVAAPFENPPAGLIEKDGRVYLPEFDFTLTLQAAQMQYQGIDPRAGVQFPGILKSPR
ncbi:MAG: TonB C-terminal domain-containing protein, partial [Myxococcota bacterium]